MKEIKVKLYRTMDDCYVELWKVVGERSKFYARYVYGRPMWYFVSDPLGYCELESPCPDDYVFAVCDPNGDRLFTDSNGTENSHPFLTLEEKTRQVWRSKNRPIAEESLNDWLLSYMTPENLAKDPDRTQFCPDLNWTACWHEIIGHEPLEEYQYLGETYCIWAVTHKHLYCDCVWLEYVAGRKDMDWEYPHFIECFGSWFNPINGPMYSMRKAADYAVEVLKEIYGEQTCLSRIIEGWHGFYERKMRLRDAAEFLVGKDLKVESVLAAVKKERENPSFFTDDAEGRAAMEAKYPGYQPDRSFKWW